MPAYHSTQNAVDARLICKMSLLPIKTQVKGPVASADDDGKDDVIDETLKFFKANVLFRNFEMKGGADRLLVYLTLYTSQCLKRLERVGSKGQADKDLYQLAIENFKLPGDGGFPLNGIVPAPESRQEADTLRQYFNMCRQELSKRLVEKVYAGVDAAGKPSKFWMCFSRKKFMNMNL